MLMTNFDKNTDVRTVLETALKALDEKEKQNEDVKLNTYLEDSAKTLSGIFYYDQKNASEPDIAFFTDKVVKACKTLDTIKKKKFYNKSVDICSSAPGHLVFRRDNTGENMLHAAIGLCTEAGEILEEVVRSKYEDTPLDVTNIKEEIGDVMWYMAIFLRDLDIDLFDAMAINIAKLRARYPGEKFSTERANNRDLNAERSILEGNGGFLPPPSIFDTKKLDEFNKVKLISQMRGLYNKGVQLKPRNPGFLYHSISEFTKPFSYLESMKDYTGSFIIKVLSSENDIKKAASDLKINLNDHLEACMMNTKVIVSVFDITGSSAKSEEKKFLLSFDFLPLYGKIKLSSILFENGESKQLSNRQFSELESFCKIKKIDIL